MSRKRIGSSLESSFFTCFEMVPASLVYDTIVVARVFTSKFDVFSLRVMVLPLRFFALSAGACENGPIPENLRRDFSFSFLYKFF